MNQYNLKNKVILVTGASRGIGREIAKSLLLSGAKVGLISRSQKLPDTTSSEFKNLGQTLYFSANINNFNDIQEITKKILEKWGRIDCLINNAGITDDKLLLRMSEDSWDKVIQTNLKGAFNCIKSVLPNMVKNKTGKIINITSVVGISGNPGQSNYCASKSGLIGLTKSIAKEYGAKSINVNAIAPGLINTDMTKKINENSLINNISLKRIGRPKDVANLTCFLCSDDADYITGEVIRIDGGLII